MLLSRFFVGAASSLVLAACVVPMAAPVRSPAAASRATAAAGTEARIFDLINAERRHQGLRPLVYNPQLDQMARIQAANMAHFQKMAHTIPGAKLPALGDRARYVGYAYGRIAENVALGYPNADAVVEGWMNSSGHRHNILDRDVTETGIAIARSSAGGVYYCQVFGRQLSSL